MAFSGCARKVNEIIKLWLNERNISSDELKIGDIAYRVT
jgi:hypothetical protein